LLPSYGEPVDLTVYRCLQEGLTNVVRHARATNVEIDLGEAPGEDDGASRITLLMRDDGRGIDAAVQPGRGLLGMQERLHALAGSCAVKGAARGGTMLRITIPLPSGPGSTRTGGTA